MCGLCGIVNFKEKARTELVQTMMFKMKHRGPDDDGIYENNEKSLVLGFVRLSIIDLSKNGHQPMLSSDERYVIIYNGEVYNYKEIRDELIIKGYKFRTTSDTEVVINSFIEWGKECMFKCQTSRESPLGRVCGGYGIP